MVEQQLVDERKGLMEKCGRLETEIFQKRKNYEILEDLTDNYNLEIRNTLSLIEELNSSDQNNSKKIKALEVDIEKLKLQLLKAHAEKIQILTEMNSIDFQRIITETKIDLISQKLREL